MNLALQLSGGALIRSCRDTSAIAMSPFQRPHPLQLVSALLTASASLQLLFSIAYKRSFSCLTTYLHS